jgi:hypothetical protein
MKIIKLSTGEEVLVDDIDYEYLSQFKWYRTTPSQCPNVTYARRYKTGSTTFIFMHREILAKTVDRPLTSKEISDHIDHNGLNNQRHNLRITDNQGNGRNKKAYKGSKSKYKGVSWHQGTKSWQVFISIGKKNKYLGQFDSEEKAAEAYDVAALDLFKEFACLNRNLYPEDFKYSEAQPTQSKGR